MLYGVSLLAGVLGSVHMPTMAVQLADLFATAADVRAVMVLVLGGLMVMVGSGVQAFGGSVSFLVPRCFRRSQCRSQCVFVDRFEGGGLGTIGASGHWLWRAERPKVRCRCRLFGA